MDERPTEHTPPPDWPTVQDAAKMERVGEDAIYKRIRRGTLRSHRDATGRTRVDPTQLQTVLDTATDTAYDVLVEELRQRIADLQSERDAWREQARRSDHLLAAALERLPELEQPAQERPPQPEQAQEPEQERPGFWRRLFG